MCSFHNFSSSQTRTVEDDLLLKKPFQKEKHGKVAHKQVAAELLDRYVRQCKLLFFSLRCFINSGTWGFNSVN